RTVMFFPTSPRPPSGMIRSGVTDGVYGRPSRTTGGALVDASVSSVVGGGSQTEQPRTQEAPIPSGIGATEDDGMRCVCGPPGTPLLLAARAAGGAPTGAPRPRS